MEQTDFHARLQQKLAAYRPSAASIDFIQRTPLLLLVGISGAGKGTIKDELVKTGNYHYIISHTTRPPRANSGVMEQDGREYHFITLNDAESMLERGEYIEAKLYSGNIYGTSVAEVRAAHDSGQTAVADIEVQGVHEYVTIDPEVKVIFILPPSYLVWQERFLKRYGGTINQADFEKRMHTALQEIEHALHDPHFTFVINDSFERVVHEIDQLAAGTVPERDIDHARAVAHDIAEQLKLVHAA